MRTFDRSTSNAIPNLAVVVYVHTAGTTRTIPVTTGTNGEATVYFQPLAGEAGHYEVSAGLPGQPMPPPQTNFAIVGIGFSTNQVAHRLIPGVWVTNHVELRNLTAVPLTGITVILSNAPPGVIFQAFSPSTLGPYETNTLTYLLKSTAGGVDPACQLRVTSAEGATNELTLVLELPPLEPRLVVIPSSLHAAMVRGGQSTVSFLVTNAGGAASGDLEVLLPEADWLGLATPPVIPSVAAAGQAEVSLTLTPATNLTFGPYTGAVALWSAAAGQTDVPFQFDCVSALQGDLRVTVVDEFTYYAPGAPKVTNATVTLLDPYARTPITSATTGAEGVALFTNLTEAYYEVTVGAPDHGSFGTVVLVPGNQTFELTAFLARQLVSYRWIVTTQAVTDRYIFTLDTRFETDVPAPVVRVVPGALNLCDYPAETNVVNLTVFNSGLITAKAARLFFAEHPRFEIRPLTEYLGDIPGRSNVVVPLIIRRLGATNEGPSQIEAHLDWELPLGNRTDYRQVPIYVYNAGLHDCDPASPGSVPQPPPTYYSGGGGGGGGRGTVVWPPSGQAPSAQPGGSPVRPRIDPPPTFGPPPDPIVPVRLGLRLSHSAIMTRNAFEALLELANGCATPISNICVTLDIQDANGLPASGMFGIRGPETEGLGELCGTNGNMLMPSALARARWTLIPTRNAAPAGPTGYTVGGTLTFQSGQTVTIPLFPVPITVYPDARLVVDYFWERVVYSDDPFTSPKVEPAVPFGIGLRMKNIGLGGAMDVRITSAQPEIRDNQNGLRVEFQLLSTQVGTEPLRPSLTAPLGDISAGSNAVAVWRMTASLQGRFTNYTASFTHLDDLGNGNLSLIDSISNHPLVHVVRANRPVDDLVPDFLASDGYAVNPLPDNLYLSDGTVAPVAAVTSGNIDAPPSPSHTNVLLTAALPGGWAYLRITNPAPGVPLSYVKRSDGDFLVLDYNVWTTPTTTYPTNTPSYLHLLDYNSPGSYTLGYNVALYIVHQPQSTNVIAGSTANFSVQAGGTAPFAYQWFKDGLTPLAGATNATLTITNVQLADEGLYSVVVSNSAGTLASGSASLGVWVPPVITVQPQPRTNVAGEAAVFSVSAAGTPPFLYQWSKDGANLLGANGAALTIPDVQISDTGNYRVAITSPAGSTISLDAPLRVFALPCLLPVTNRTVVVGGLLVFTNQGCDPNACLIWSGDPGNPGGSSVASNGVVRWTPTCAQGSSNYVITLWAADCEWPPARSSVNFTAAVPECVEAGLGQTVMLAGTTSSVPVNLVSSTALTNMAFTVHFSSGNFTNFDLTVNSAAVLTRQVLVLLPDQVRLSFTLPESSVLYGPTNVADFWFTALSNQSSAFVTLGISNIVALKPDGVTAENASGLPGRVVLIGKEPLLEARNGLAGEPTLTLYGKPGSSYALEWRTNAVGGAWQFGWRTPMTNLARDFGIEAAKPSQFYRAYEFFADPPILEIQGRPAGSLPLLVYGRPGTNYVLESSPVLGPQAHWLPEMSLTLSNSFEYLPLLPMTNQSQFLRIRE